jgi:hypothetical protein
MKRWTAPLAFVMALALSRTAPATDDPQEGVAFFEAKIRPVLIENCYKCHGPEKQKGLLRLDSKEAMLKGGGTGPVLVPGKANDSLILAALRHQDGLKMPPSGKLSEAVIADFAKWIAMGAPDPRTGTAVVAKGINWTEARKFWSFQPVVKPGLPVVKTQGWIKTPIDAFILAKLEEHNLQPVRFASKRELIRRATFDLTGLPPTPEEVEAFLQDNAADAFDKVIDRLLASPHYGERWGRYWLDVARYAEDQAHTFEVQPYTSAWRYRDWVIAALNEDMPYDRFIKLQIAADLVEKDEAGRLKHVPALGYFGLGAQYYKNTDAAKAAADELDDRIDTLTRGFLGLTVSCARCHDHKFDPIPTADYYSLAGIFNSCKLANVLLASQEQQQRFQAAQEKLKKIDGDMKSLVRQEKIQHAEQMVDEVAKYLTAAWHYKVQRQKAPQWSVNDQAKKEKLSAAVLGKMVKFLEKPPAHPLFDVWKKLQPSDEAQAEKLAQSVEDAVKDQLAKRNGKPAGKGKIDLVQGLVGETGVFAPSDEELKGLLSAEKKQRLQELQTELAKLQKDDAARPLPMAHGLVEAKSGNMKVFVRGNPANQGETAPRRFLKILAGDNPPEFTQGSGRLELAEAIASKDNPLTARVIVNRIWLHHFGRGLVGTPSNFGKLGERPSHPELLDYLAAKLVESGWSLKALHRELMRSAVYQLSSTLDARNFGVDGDNRWLWRMNRQRLDVEAWRDAMLAVAGKLDRTVGGSTLELSAGNNVRRTVYAKISRHDLNYLLRLFDFPDANITSERRTETTVPQQQLFFLNSPFVLGIAKALAARVQAEVADEPGRVQRAFLLVYGRPATAEESRVVLDYLGRKDTPAEQAENRLSRWERFAQVLLGSNEFMYVD